MHGCDDYCLVSLVRIRKAPRARWWAAASWVSPPTSHAQKQRLSKTSAGRQRSKGAAADGFVDRRVVTEFHAAFQGSVFFASPGRSLRAQSSSRHETELYSVEHPKVRRCGCGCCFAREQITGFAAKFELLLCGKIFPIPVPHCKSEQ